MLTTAAVARGDGGFEIAEVELDHPRPDEVLVDVVAVGLCHTDLSAASGRIPFPAPGVLGHEGAGRVRQVGTNVTRVEVGDAVLMTFTSCGRCTACRDGHPAYCEHHLRWNLLGGSRADGSPTIHEGGTPVHGHFFGQSSFARNALVDERSLVRLPVATTDEELAVLAPLGCGMQTGAGAVLNVLRPPTHSTVVVAGAGAVGLAAVMAAAATSVRRIVAIDVVDERLELAMELGATDRLNPAVVDVRSALLELTDGHGVAYAIDTTGNTSVIEDMVASLAVRGTCVVIGAPAAGARASFDVNAHLPGRQVIGVTLGDSDPETLIPQLISMHRSGRFPMERLQRRYAFDDISTAAHDAHDGRTIKPVLIMGPDAGVRA